MLLLALLGCDAPVYYPELGSNQLVWEPEGGVVRDTSAPSDTGAPLPPGATEVIELDPGDSPPCATGDITRTTSLQVQNLTAYTVEAYTVDDRCYETYSTQAPTGQSLFLTGYVGAAYVLRVEDTLEPLYAIVLGEDGGSWVIQ